MQKRMMVVAALAVLQLTAVGCTAEEKKVELKDLRDKVSYSIGLNLGRDFSQQSIDVDAAILAQGIRDAVAGAKPMLTDDEMRQAITDFQKELVAKQEAKAKEEGAKNVKTGEEYLAANAKKEGVKTTASGLQYKVLTPGGGKKPSAESTVTVHYRGTFIDGKEFDSSYTRNEPATFPVSGVIPGWTEALQLMQEGAKYQLAIPAKLAYGERGAPPAIGPNATLLFEVELLKVQ